MQGNGFEAACWTAVSSLDITSVPGATQAAGVRFLAAGLGLGAPERYGGKGSLPVLAGDSKGLAGQLPGTR